MKALLSSSMECPDAETLADLAQTPGDLERRAAIADHASECESCRAVLAAVLGAPPERERIGRYLVGRRLGAGGMGVVYQARDPELQREVAIKMLYRGAPAERMRREAQALARLAHPNVVAVHDVGEHEGQTFIAMALVDGETLRRWLAIERSGREIIRVLCAAARGIEAAHAARLVHRDLKPDNVFVARDGSSLVGDFGLARDRSPGDSITGMRVGDIPIGDAETLLSGDARGGVDLTETGTVLGTPAYMAPEQAAGAATEQSDQFSFCVMAYEALYGCRPFAGANLDELCGAAERGEVRAPRRDPGVGPAVLRALRRGLSANPADRFPSMTALRLAIEPRPRRWPIAVGGVAALAAASAITWAATRPAEAPDPEITCAATRSAFVDTWNPTKRASWIATLQGAGKTKEAAVELAARLDRFADGWTALRHDTCVAQATGTLADDRAAHRVACLETRRAQFEATATSTGPEDVFALWRRIASLPDAATCQDPNHAFGPGYAALVVAAAKTRDVKELTAIAAKADAQGDERAQLALTLRLAADALAEDHLPDADKYARRATTLAESLAAPVDRVLALSLSARALCLAGKGEESRRFLEIAIAASRTQPDTVADVRFTRAQCLFYEQKFDEALPLLVESLDHAVRRYGRDSFEAFDLHRDLAVTYQATNQIEKALHELEEWKRLDNLLVGQENPLAAQALDALQKRDFDTVIELQRRLIKQTEDESGDVQSRRMNLTNTLEIVGDWRGLVTVCDQILRDAPKEPTEDQRLALVKARLVRGEAQLHLGKLAPAATDFAQVIVDAETLKHGDLVLRGQLGNGRIAAEQGDHARAVRILRAALPAWIASRPSRFTLGEAQFAYARAQWASGDRAGARSSAREAEEHLAASADHALEHPPTARFGAFLRGRHAVIERWRVAHP